MRVLIIFLTFLFVFAVSTPSGMAQTDETLNSESNSETSPDNGPQPSDMTGEALKAIIMEFDKKAELNDTSAIFTINDRQVMLAFDENAGRMRLLSPIVPSELLTDDLKTRLLQANYDAVLDVRYAIANGLLWSVFIHPLPSLTEDDFISAIAQTITAAETFGTSFTSGTIVFGGGDSGALHDDLLKRLEELRKSEEDRQRI